MPADSPRITIQRLAFLNMQTKVTLTDIIRNILTTQQELSVKDILTKVQETIAGEQLTIQADYRKVYRHLRTCATKTARGQFSLTETSAS
jgi:hypothetical protein